MATNHTTNYNLNLWEPSDNFVREEFNENTNKIEAALVNHDAALATKVTTDTLNALAARVTALENKPRYVKLKERNITVKGNTAVDVSDIDWSQWNKVHMEFKAPSSQSFYIRVNDLSDTDHDISCYVMTNQPSPFFTFFPAFNPQRGGYIFYMQSIYNRANTYADYNSLIFLGNISNLTVTFWGEK